ncbi:MAG: hypothetical protein U1F11_04825 [Steroidobacteraceae bacterium]
MSDTDRRAAPPLPDPPNQGFNAALQGPVLGIEPDFLRALPIDNLVGTIVALTAEVWMLRERLGTLESELTARKLLPAGAVENHAGGPEEQQARAAERLRATPSACSPSWLATSAAGLEHRSARCAVPESSPSAGQPPRRGARGRGRRGQPAVTDAAAGRWSCRRKTSC